MSVCVSVCACTCACVVLGEEVWVGRSLWGQGQYIVEELATERLMPFVLWDPGHARCDVLFPIV